MPDPMVARGTSSRADDLLAALRELVELTDRMTHAVEGHDLAGLTAATEAAGAMSGRVGELDAALTPAERATLDTTTVAALSGRLRIGARRNAYLIEHAWAFDAALLRLLMRLGMGEPAAGPSGASPAFAGYATVPAGTAAYFDRHA